MQHQLVGSEESTPNTVGVNVNIDIEAEERRNELLRERIRMTRELLEKELSPTVMKSNYPESLGLQALWPVALFFQMRQHSNSSGIL